jgi:hypothetical protein
MTRGVSLYAFGQATGLFLAIAFAVCVAFDFLFPTHAMYRTWETLLPGFTWISWTSVGLGLVESYGYGWFVALIWVPLYNVFAAREAGPRVDVSRHAA